MTNDNAYPHRIRLRGPWECVPIPPADGLAPPPHRVVMPCRWPEAGLAGFRGLVRFLRKFGYPGRIDDFEHVWLTCDGCTGCLELRVNQHLVAQAPGDRFAYDITPLLSQRNLLEVLMEGQSDDAGLRGEVAMEIRCAACLADMHAVRTATGLHIAGIAAGTAPQPLDLYTIIDGSHADYRTIQPTAEGRAFQIDLPEISAQSPQIRVELVHVSCIWYVAEMSLTS